MHQQLQRRNVFRAELRRAPHGFVASIRRAHPHVPIAVITPVLSLPREDKPNAVGWTLTDYRRATAEVAAALQGRGDRRVHLIDGATVFTSGEALKRLSDTLPPDAAGYAIMAERPAPQLAALLGGVPAPA